MQETTLGKIAEIQTGPFGSQLHESDYVSIGTPIITVQHLVGDRIHHSPDIPKVSSEDTERLARRYALQEGDIVFSRVGSVDRSAYVTADEDGWLFSGRLLRVRPNTEVVDNKWLDYWLRQPSIREFVRKIAVGATMPSINTSLLGEVPVTLLEINVQKKVAAALSSLDVKIELLRKQNLTLEDIAETLYRQLLIKYTDSTQSLFDVSDVLGGGTPNTKQSEYYDGSIPFFTPKDAHDEIYVLETEKYLTEEGLKNCSSELFPTNTVFITARGTVGKVALAGVPMAMNQSCYAFRAKDERDQYFLYLLLKHKTSELLGRSHGSVFQTITLDTFRSMAISIPDESELIDFHDAVFPLFQRMKQNMLSMRTLASMRDTILPRLMNGSLQVAE